MTGDSILIYDPAKEAFFAGWYPQAFRHTDKTPCPRWSKTVDGARISDSLGRMQEIVRMIGGQARIVSETRARQIESINRCMAEVRAQRARG